MQINYLIDIVVILVKQVVIIQDIVWIIKDFVEENSYFKQEDLVVQN